MAGTPTDERQFPILEDVLSTYFATGREPEFLARYGEVGEASAEFRGLSDDLDRARRNPGAAAAAINACLGTSLDSQTVRDPLIDLQDAISGSPTPAAAVTPDGDADDDDDGNPATPTPDELMSYYFFRRVNIAGRVVPLWWILGAGVALLVVGFGLSQSPVPDWLHPLVVVIEGLGLLLAFGAAVTMMALRSDLQQTAKEAAARAHDATVETKGGRGGIRAWLRGE